MALWQNTRKSKHMSIDFKIYPLIDRLNYRVYVFNPEEVLFTTVLYSQLALWLFLISS